MLPDYAIVESVMKRIRKLEALEVPAAVRVRHSEALADVTLTTTPQAIPGCTLSLRPGTYLITGSFTFVGVGDAIGYCYVNDVEQPMRALATVDTTVGHTVAQTWRVVVSTDPTVIELRANGTPTVDVDAENTNISAIGFISAT